MKKTIIIALLLISAFSAKQIQAQTLDGFTLGETFIKGTHKVIEKSDRHFIDNRMVAGIRGGINIFVIPSDETIYGVGFRSDKEISEENFIKIKNKVEKKYKVKLSRVEVGGYNGSKNIDYSYEYKSDKLSVYCAKLKEEKEIFIKIESPEIRDRF